MDNRPFMPLFSSAQRLVEPQVALNVLSGGGQTATTVGLGTQLGNLFNGPDVNFLGRRARLSVGFGRRLRHISGFALGGTFGYRILAGTRVGVRFEGGYRRWFDSKLNEFTFGMGIGGIVRRTQ